MLQDRSSVEDALAVACKNAGAFLRSLDETPVLSQAEVSVLRERLCGELPAEPVRTTLHARFEPYAARHKLLDGSKE